MQAEVAFTHDLLEEFAEYLSDFQDQTNTSDITLYCIMQHMCALLDEEYGLRFIATDKVYMQ